MIKKIILLLFISLPCFQVFSQSESAAGKQTPEISFETIAHDFGNISKNESVEFEFTYNNNGNRPLIIESVKKTCTCTRVKWTKKPLLPGERDKLTVTFKSKEEGVFYKIVEVKTNADKSPVLLTIRGKVE